MGLSIEEFKKALPLQIRRSINPKTLQNINNIVVDPEVAEAFRDNLLSYTNVMRDGKYKIESYINAVKYVSYKLMNYCNRDAYQRTFPDKYLRLVAKGKSGKDIAAHVAMYNKGKLVNLVYEQTLVPSHILNHSMFQDALNTQAELMMSAKSEKVRSDAANSILTHLKRPETQKLELDIGIKEDSTIQALRDSTMALVQQQRTMLESNYMSASEVAESDIIVVEASDE
jgi:hypothetical protein